MEKPKKLNKAVTDSISSLLEQGVNVNINVKTEMMVKLVFFAFIITVVVAGTNYFLYWIKKK